MIIIGIAGFGGAGKTSVSNIFVQQHGFKKFSFAQPIKDALALWGAHPGDIADPVQKLEPSMVFSGNSLVQMMESLGAWGRSVHEDFWVQRTLSSIATQCANLVIVDDVRHQNEADAIIRNGGFVWRINRTGLMPTRPTDFKVQELTSCIDLQNTPGANSVVCLYEAIKQKAFSNV